jgi:hypothetical protein
MIAVEQGGLFNATKLAQNLAVSRQSITRYLALLVELMHLLHFTTQARSAFNVVLPRQLLRHPVIGQSFEGFAIEICGLSGTQWRYSFYRTQNGAEIDSIAEHGADVLAIEIKRSSKPVPSRGFYSDTSLSHPTARYKGKSMTFAKTMTAIILSALCAQNAGAAAAFAARSGAGRAGADSSHHCAPLGLNQTQLVHLQKQKFAGLSTQKTQRLALALAGCLGDPDSKWRDEIAFASLSGWMRAERLEVSTRRLLLGRLQTVLAQPPEADNRFHQSFAALVLAEIVRTHRINPWMDDIELGGLVQSGTRFLNEIRDYRGYSDQLGWQHAVAHSADLMLQLSLLPELQIAQLQAIADAIASQVPAHNGHSYIFDESDRLAAPVYYLSQRKFLSAEQWRDWFVRLAQVPKGFRKEQVFSSEKTLAWRHNVKAFLLCALANAGQVPDPTLKNSQIEAISAALKTLP